MWWGGNRIKSIYTAARMGCRQRAPIHEEYTYITSLPKQQPVFLLQWQLKKYVFLQPYMKVARFIGGAVFYHILQKKLVKIVC